MLEFHEYTIRALLHESTYDFLTTSDGYFKAFEKMNLDISPSASIYPHLQHCHVVWSLQRLAESLFQDKKYVELDGLVNVEGSRRGSEVTVGTLGIRAIGSIANDDSTSVDTLAALDAATGAPINVTDTPETTELTLNSQGDSNDTNIDKPVIPRKFIDTRFFSPTRPLQSLKVFLTVIRALACIAESRTNDIIDTYLFRDHIMGVTIKFDAVTSITHQQQQLDDDLDATGNRDTEDNDITTTFGNLAESLQVIVATMVKARRFAACAGEMYEVPDPKKPREGRKLVGLVTVKAIDDPNGGQEGNIEGAEVASA